MNLFYDNMLSQQDFSDFHFCLKWHSIGKMEDEPICGAGARKNEAPSASGVWL